MKIATIFGGNGFLGKYITKQLLHKHRDVKIQIVSRNASTDVEYKILGNTGRIASLYGDIRNKESIERYIKNANYVINTVGILNAKCKGDFHAIHAKGAENVASLCAQYDVESFMHISSLGIQDNNSVYAQSKISGEKAVIAAFPRTIIIRSSALIGQEDNLSNKFANMISFMPFLLIPHCDTCKMQPICVRDVAQFIDNVMFDENLQGKIYEIAGPKIYTMKEFIEIIMKKCNKRRKIINMPYWLANASAAIFEIRIISFLMRPLTGSYDPIITRDQIKLMQSNSIIDKDSQNSAVVHGIKLDAAENILDKYIAKQD